MKSKDLLDKIILLSNTIIENLKIDVLNSIIDYDSKLNIEFKNNRNKFSNLFKELYENCEEDNFFWEYCPFIVYEANYKSNKDKFLLNYTDASEIDFVNIELKIYKEKYKKEHNEFIFNNSYEHIKIPEGYVFYFTETEYLPLPILVDQDLYNKIHFSNNRKINFLESKINLNKSTNTTENNPASEIFKLEGYKLFKYLDENYIRDNKTPKAKYSYIYHFLSYEGMIIGTQEMYIDYIENYSGEKLSKIQPKQYKYQDKIQPHLLGLKKNFDSLNKIE